MDVAIVKYNAGNIRSVVNAVRRMGLEPEVTDSPERLARADRVIFPGQGEASSTMAYLRARGLDKAIRSLRQPVLGICIGMQLMCRHSEEGDTDCLGIFDAEVVGFRRLPAARRAGAEGGGAAFKVPQMGWNTIVPCGRGGVVSPLLRGLGSAPYVYFVHSFCVPPCADAIATTDYIAPYASALQRDNFFATQFHPEKSGAVGEQILGNFLSPAL